MSQNTTLDARKDTITLWASFIFLMIAWGSSFILVKRSLVSFPPAQVVSIRLVAAMVALIGLAVVHFKHIARSKLPYIFLSAMLGIFVPAYLFAFSQVGMSSSVVGVLNALTPCMTFIVGVSFFQQPSNKFKILGLTIGFIGSAILILANSKGQLSVSSYVFLVIAATVCYGVNLNIVKRFLPEVKSFHISTVTVAISGILSLVYLLTTNFWIIIQTTENGKSSLLAAVLLGLLGTAAAQTVFNRMLQISTAVFASSITYFIPIVAVLWGVWDGEILNAVHYLGMALIIGGVIILNRLG